MLDACTSCLSGAVSPLGGMLAPHTMSLAGIGNDLDRAAQVDVVEDLAARTKEGWKFLSSHIGPCKAP